MSSKILRKIRWTRPPGRIPLLLISTAFVLLTLAYLTATSHEGPGSTLNMDRHNIRTESDNMNPKEGLLSRVGSRLFPSKNADSLPTKVTSDDIIKERFLARSQQANRACRLLSKKYKISPEIEKNLFNFAHGRLKWCRNFKVASSFIIHLDSILPAETNNITHAQNFLIVREPYSRLVSGYIDRFVTFPPLWDRYGTSVISKFRSNITLNGERCGHDVTFPEFIKYVIHSQETGWLKDLHFFPMSGPCNPCQIHFDYICHLDTLKEDIAYVLKFSNITHHGLDLDIDESVFKAKVKRLFVEAKTVTRCQSMCNAFRTLWWAFQSRGLIPRHLSFPLSEAECRKNMTENIFGDVCWDTYKRYLGTFDKYQEIRKTIVELFRQVPLEDRIKVRDLLALDFALFGYEDQPDDIFPELAKDKKSAVFTPF